jgi:hypothetical protein
MLSLKICDGGIFGCTWGWGILLLGCFAASDILRYRISQVLKSSPWVSMLEYTPILNSDLPPYFLIYRVFIRASTARTEVINVFAWKQDTHNNLPSCSKWHAEILRVTDLLRCVCVIKFILSKLNSFVSGCAFKSSKQYSRKNLFILAMAWKQEDLYTFQFSTSSKGMGDIRRNASSSVAGWPDQGFKDLGILFWIRITSSQVRRAIFLGGCELACMALKDNAFSPD